MSLPKNCAKRKSSNSHLLFYSTRILLLFVPFPAILPNMSTPADPKPVYELYRYTPSLEAAAIFAALFAGTTIVHIYQLVKTKAWYFTPFVVGGVCEYLPPPTPTLRV